MTTPPGGAKPKPPRTWRPMALWMAGILLTLGLAWFVWSVLMPGPSGEQRGKSAQLEAAKKAAVAMSLENFFSGRWNLPDPVVFIESGPYAEAAPRRLDGKDVEFISEEALLKRYSGRDFSPCLTRIHVYDVNGDPKVVFHVEVSVSGVWAKGYSFKSVMLGGARVYEFSLVSGKPVLGKTHIVTF